MSENDGILRCERCGGTARGFGLIDYCADCSKPLCERCMADGCCGKTPAESGQERDYGDDAPERPAPPSQRGRR